MPLSWEASLRLGPPLTYGPILSNRGDGIIKRRPTISPLRSDIVFHNGRRATAQDLEYSLLRGFFTNQRSFYKLYLDNIDGVEEAENRTSYGSGAVRGVQITGPLTVRIRLKTPNAGFLHSLVDGYFSLVPREAMKEGNTTWKDAPIGAGPFRVVSPFQNGQIIIESIAAPRRKLILYTQDSESTYDVSLIDPPEVAAASYSRYIPELSTAVWTMFFSKNHPLSQSASFRKAVSYLVNQDELAQGLNETKPAYEMLPRHFWGRAQLRSRHNLMRARQELNQVPAELKSKPIEVAIFAGAKLPYYREQILERLRVQFAAAGLLLQVTLTRDKFFSDADSRRFPIKIFGMVTDYVDPVVMFSGFHRGSPYENLRPVDDTRFEELYERTIKIEDQEKKIAAVQELSYLVCEDLLAVPMVEESLVTYYQRRYIDGLGDQFQPLTLILENLRFKE